MWCISQRDFMCIKISWPTSHIFLMNAAFLPLGVGGRLSRSGGAGSLGGEGNGEEKRQTLDFSRIYLLNDIFFCEKENEKK